MNILYKIILLGTFTALLLCIGTLSYAGGGGHGHAEDTQEEPEKGSHNGRLLKSGDFTLELAIVETGIPPEFRAWFTYKDKTIRSSDVSLNIILTRLGGIEDNINFTAQNDFLRGDMEVYEPHSFIVSVEAQYQGKNYHWHYDNFEGRTKIDEKIASRLEIKTSIAKSQMLKETIKAYGKLALHPQHTREISARFGGLVKKVHVKLGQQIESGQALITVESNESLKSYTIYSPIRGTIQQLNAFAGEQTGNKILLSIIDTSTLFAEMAVFPTDRNKISLNANVSLSVKGLEQTLNAKITQINQHSEANQSVIIRAELANKTGELVAGAFITGEIEVAEYSVELAVKRQGLQAFRDFTVVFEKINDEYEVRMLTLGRTAGQWVEVLGGLKPGAQYVSENSYIIKADIEKSGASHDH